MQDTTAPVHNQGIIAKGTSTGAFEHFGWDTIKVEAVDFELDYMESELISAPWYCEKEVFVKFITAHLDEFDIADNVHADCPAFSCWMNNIMD